MIKPLPHTRFGAFFALFMLLAQCSLHAQFKKGTLVPGFNIGSAYFNSGKTEYSAPAPTNGYTSSTNSTGFRLSPSLGLFISDKTLVGVYLNGNYGYEKYIDASNNITFRKLTINSFSAGLGLFARNYFGTGRFLPFAQLNIDGGIGSSKTNGFNYTTVYRESFTGKSSGDFLTNAGLSVGVTRLLSEEVGLDLSFGYTFTHQKKKFKQTTLRDVGNDGSIDESSMSDLSTKINNHGLAIAFGIQVFLARH